MIANPALTAPLPTRRFLFHSSSARAGGNSEALARRAAESLSPEVAQRWMRLVEHPMEAFEDRRHAGTGTYPPPAGHAAALLEATLEATDLVFVAPVYWYSLPASAKLYLDHWSGWLRVPGLDFKARMAGKRLHAVTVGSGSPEDAEPLVGALRRSARYMGMGFEGMLFGNGSRPGDVLQDAAALAAARTFFELRVVAVAAPDA